MNVESQTMLNELLSYLYGSFVITYGITVMGLIVKNVLLTKKPSPISVCKLLIAPVPVTVVLCVARDNVYISFPLYVLLCVIGGSCSDYIGKIFISGKLPAAILKILSKTVKDPVISAIADVALEADKADKETENKKDEVKKEEEEELSKEDVIDEIIRRG